MHWKRLAVRGRVATLALALLGGMALLQGCKPSPPQPPSAHEVQEFRNAVNDGDALIVDRLLAAKPGLVNVRDETGKTPLTVARERGDDEMAQVLSRHGGRD